MNLTIARIFGNSGRSAKYVFNKRAQMLLFSNTNIQGRYKITKANVIERSKYKPSEGSIGFFGYCLLASNYTDEIVIQFLYRILNDNKQIFINETLFI